MVPWLPRRRTTPQNNNHAWTTQRIPTSSAARVCNTNSEFHGPLQAQHLRRGWTTQRIPTSSADNVCTTISRQTCNLMGRNLTTTRIPISSATCCRPGTTQLWNCTLWQLWWCGCHGAVKTPKVNTAPTCCVNPTLAICSASTDPGHSTNNAQYANMCDTCQIMLCHQWPAYDNQGHATHRSTC